MHRLVFLALVALLIAALAACGGPTTPLPEPDLALTGVTPANALPGAQVVLQGEAFEAGQAVTFDGVTATVVAITDTTMTVVVPQTYGYPVIAIEDVSAERLLFVGAVYAGSADLAGVQAALDALSEGAALRLPAGTYGAPGTGLAVDNRQLFGAGPTTILEVPDTLDLYTRSTNVTVLQELAVTGGGDVEVGRGRLATAATHPAVPAGMVRLQDLDLTVGTLRPDDDYVHVLVSGATIDAVALIADATGSTIEIEDSTIVLSDNWNVDTYGGLSVRDTTIETTNDIYVNIDYVTSMTFERATLTAGGSVHVYFYDAVVPNELVILDSEISAGSYAYVGSSSAPIVIDASTLTAVGYLDIDGDDYGAHITLADATVTAGESIDLGGGYAGILVLRSVVTAGTYVDVDAYGPIVFDDATITAEADSVYVYSDYSDALLMTATTVSAATYVSYYLYGPILIAGGAIEAGTHVDMTSWSAGEITVRDTTSISAGTDFELRDGGSGYAGNNGKITFANNATTTAGATFGTNVTYADVIVAGNGPIAAADVSIDGTNSHVTLTDNARIEADNDVRVYAALAGGRLWASDNVFVAGAGAGTITLETQAGALTQSGNTFTGTLVTPNNP